MFVTNVSQRSQPSVALSAIRYVDILVIIEYSSPSKTAFDYYMSNCLSMLIPRPAYFYTTRSINVMTTDALAPCVARSPAAMVLPVDDENKTARICYSMPSDDPIPLMSLGRVYALQWRHTIYTCGNNHWTTPSLKNLFFAIKVCSFNNEFFISKSTFLTTTVQI